MTEEKTSGDRIAKVMARAGVASRRDAERMIVEGRVAVNGKPVTSPALDVAATDRVTLDGKPIDAPQAARLWLYYKPLGLVTSNKDEKGRQTVFDTLPQDMPRVMSIGRLDLNSEGLLLLTNDGALKRRLELPSTGWLRKYRVRVNGRPNDATFDPLRRGVTIEGEEFLPMDISLDRQQGANAWLTVGLREGKNREIRRAMTEVGLTVNRLIRVSYGPFRLNTMKPGDVVEVKQKTLREQLGEGVVAKPSEGDAAPRARGPRQDDGNAPRKSFKPRGEGEGFDRKPRTPRGSDGAGERKTFRPRGEGPAKPYAPRGEGAPDRKPYKPRDEDGANRKPYKPRDEGGSFERKPRAAGAAATGGDRKAYAPRGDSAAGDRKSFKPRAEGSGPDRKPYKARAEAGADRKPYAPRGEGGSDRKAYAGGAERKTNGPRGEGGKFDRASRDARPEGGASDRKPFKSRGTEGGFDRKPSAARGPRPEGPKPGPKSGPKGGAGKAPRGGGRK